MSRQGFGCCERREAFICFGAERQRECDCFDPATADVVAKRVEWLAGKKREAKI